MIRAELYFLGDKPPPVAVESGAGRVRSVQRDGTTFVVYQSADGLAAARFRVGKTIVTAIAGCVKDDSPDATDLGAKPCRKPAVARQAIQQRALDAAVSLRAQLAHILA
jgi:hypothetical protein